MESGKAKKSNLSPLFLGVALLTLSGLFGGWCMYSFEPYSPRNRRASQQIQRDYINPAIQISANSDGDDYWSGSEKVEFLKAVGLPRILQESDRLDLSPNSDKEVSLSLNGTDLGCVTTPTLQRYIDSHE